jgi:hypothetical protein
MSNHSVAISRISSGLSSAPAADAAKAKASESEIAAASLFVLCIMVSE